jgi:hypothetical protein
MRQCLTAGPPEMIERQGGQHLVPAVEFSGAA